MIEPIFSPSKWRVARLIALGYYDGPTEGLVELADGSGVYRFDMIDADPERDLRAIKLSALPSDTFDEIVNVLESELGPARWPVWVPRWEFGSEARRHETEERIDSMCARARPFAIAACDDTLERCLKVAPIPDRTAADIKQWMRS
ncbi:MAG: hypothetical protein LC667_07095 [Thioalkalivibrio sp.]|nr:hypothetical protein [Thioalkalivibrio sp.]